MVSIYGSGSRGIFLWFRYSEFQSTTMCYFISPLDDEELDGDGAIDPGIEYAPPPRGVPGTVFMRKKQELIKQEPESEDDTEDARDDGRKEKSECRKDKGEVGPAPAPRYAPLSLYEERMLLRRLDACPQALAVTPQANRLRRKLLVRQAKRERGLPLLDVDQAVSAALSLVGGMYGAQVSTVSETSKYRMNSQDLRILDRFQVRLCDVTRITDTCNQHNSNKNVRSSVLLPV